MFDAIRRFLARVFEPWPTTHRALATEAAAASQSEGPSTLVVLAEALYLPHGGRDRVVLRIRPDGGHVERTRIPYQREPLNAARELTAEESAQVLNDLRAWDIWGLSHHREPVRDGLVCGFAFAEKDRVHSVQLHCGAGDPEQLQLLRFLSEIMPIDEPAPFAYTTPTGEIGLRMGK